MERMKFEQECAREGVAVASQRRYDSVPEPEQTGYKPTRRDPLLHGVGRATGDTARALKSKQALRKADIQPKE